MVEGNTRLEKMELNLHNIKGNKNRKKKKKKRPKQEKKETSPDTTVIKCNKISVTLQPVITKDSRHIICPCGNTIAIFRRKTGLLEKLFTEHKYNVSNIYINHQDPTQVISCSSKEFLLWDYADVSLVKRYDLPFAAISWYVSPRCYEDVYYKSIIKKEGGKHSNKEELIRWNVTGASNPIVVGNVSKVDKCVEISRNGDYVAYSYKNKLSIYTPLHNKSNSFVFDDTHITCIALHPTELVVCTGDKKGKIVLWYNLFSGGSQICTRLHWHNLSVADMLFTNDGNYLMTGGKEGVLVIWQLETQEKSFVPRVGGAIHHLVQSNDDQYICLSLDNNMLKILSAVTSKLTKTIKYLAPAYELPAGLTYHHPTDCLVLNGRPDGVLQFYHPKEDFLKLCIDVIGENLVSDVEGRYVYPTRVKLVAFSHDGTWMATFDEREDRILPTERKLKFWEYSEEKKNYSLNTLVDPPHKSTISSLLFRPHADSVEYNSMVVTTSEDGDVKTWSATKDTDRNGNVMESWQIHSIGSYGINSCRHACFSQDGSLLAVLFCVVTLWDPDSLTFTRCLQFNAKDESIKYIAFGNDESSRFLIGYSSNYLVVWNVEDTIGCSIVWMMEAKVALITCDPYSKYCAVFVKPKDGKLTDLYLFDPASPPPLSSYHNVTKGYARISSALFTPNKCKSPAARSVWQETGQLYILTKDTEILAVKELITKKEEEEEEEDDENEASSRTKESSTFEDIFGSISKEKLVSHGENDDKGTPRESVGNKSSALIRKMISTPANVLPSADIICRAYIKSLLLPKPDTRDGEDVSKEIEEPETEDIEEDKETTIPDSGVYPSRHADEYAPSEELLEQLAKLNFDFVTDSFR